MAQTPSAQVSSPALLPAASPWTWWSRLFVAGRLAIAPSRVLTAFFLIVMLGAVIRVPDLFATGDTLGMRELPSTLVAARADLMQDQLSDHRFLAAARTLVATPVALARTYPLHSLAMLLPICLLWGLLGGCIARGASVEFATGVRQTWSRSMGQSISRWHSLTMVTFGPLLLAGLLLATLPAIGWLLDVRFAQYAAGALYVVPLLLAFLATGLVLLVLISLPMLVSGVMSEGGQALEACQRAFAYVLAQPLRLLVAMLALGAVGVAMLALISLLTQLALSTSAYFTTLWVSDSAADLLRAQALTGREPSFSSAPDALATTGMLVGFWSKVAAMLAPSVLISFVFTAGSVLYLSMRQAVDGQHPRDVWDPTQGPRLLLPATTDVDVASEDES